MSTDINKHLNCVLESHKIKKEQVLLDKHISKRNEIKEALEEKYRANIYTPFNSGSYAKNTAVNTKFDFDFMVPFKREAFDTLENMFNDVCDFLEEKYKTSAIVKKQKVSIGLEFFPDEIGDVIKIDVVPGRELNRDQYLTDKNLNLFVYNQFGTYQKGSERIQSNIHAQVNKIRRSADTQSLRRIIRLLKVWKLYNNKSLKSFFIELISIRAFEDKEPEGAIWEILEVVLVYIKDNIETIALMDPGNSNNNVADSLSSIEKSVLKSDIINMLEQIKLSSDFIKTYFPSNPKFPCEDKNESNNKYGVKKEGLSIPPPTRFGKI